jgi:hypothetical protein
METVKNDGASQTTEQVEFIGHYLHVNDRLCQCLFIVMIVDDQLEILLDRSATYIHASDKIFLSNRFETIFSMQRFHVQF